MFIIYNLMVFEYFLNYFFIIFKAIDHKLLAVIYFCHFFQSMESLDRAGLKGKNLNNSRLGEKIVHDIYDPNTGVMPTVVAEASRYRV